MGLRERAPHRSLDTCCGEYQSRDAQKSAWMI
jgi:hypothetical protein